MVQNVNVLNWQATSSGDGDYIATVECDSSVDATWNIGIQGTDINGTPVLPTYFIIDNLGNNGTATIIYGPFSFAVPPFTRRTFQLPSLLFTLQVIVSVGVVTVYLCQNPADVPDEQNQSAINQSTKVVAFTPRSIVTNTNQALSDNNTIISPWGAGGFC